MNMIPLTIIVSAYNRADTIAALFSSFDKLKCNQQVDLVISIDNQGTEELNSLAQSFQWRFGKKEVVIHNEKLGLINHFIWVGDQTEKYEHVLFLEDDMYVSPQMLNYALQVIPEYENDDRVAGCSLYNPPFTLSGLIFDKISDSYDNFFYQHPYWGNIWYKNKWNDFKRYLKTYRLNDSILPITVQSWRSSSFKKIFIQYLVETNRTIVYPRISLLTNMGAPGLHCSQNIEFVQVPIEFYSSDKKYRFSTLDVSCAKYDSFEEIDTGVIRSFNTKLSNYDFVIDTKLNRNQYPTPYVLTTRKTRGSVLSFATGMKPTENNVLFNNVGCGLSLCRVDDVILSETNEIMIMSSNISSHFALNKERIVRFEFKEAIKNNFKRIKRKIQSFIICS